MPAIVANNRALLTPAKPVVPLTTKLIFAGTTSFVPPAGVYFVKIEIQGAAGNGVAGVAGSRRGGGGGEHATKFRLAVVPGVPISCSVAAGGSETDTWFGSTSTVLAKPGLNGNNATNPGGGGTGGVGDLLHPGGRGGIPGAGSFSATGGGGAGGPDGPGKSGGNTSASANHGSGGGGCDGNASDRGGAGDASNGGAGGNGPWNTGGGAAGVSSAGSPGSNGGGGGGAQGTGLGGGAGSQFAIWTDSVTGTVAGPGSGGGGASGGAGVAQGGVGGGYGGGAGGSGGGGTGVTGQPGLITVTYESATVAASTVTGPVTLLLAGASTSSIQFTGEVSTNRFGKTRAGPINWQSRLSDKYLWNYDLRVNTSDPYWQSTDILAGSGAKWNSAGSFGISIQAQASAIVTRLGAISGPALVYLAMSRNDLDDGMSGPDWCTQLSAFLSTVVPAMGTDDRLIVEGPWYVNTSAGGNWASGGSARTAITYMIANIPAICAAFGSRVIYMPLVDRLCLPTGDRNPLSGILTDDRHANELGGLINWFQLQKLGINSLYITPASIPGASGSAPAFTGTLGGKGTSVTGNVYTGYSVDLSDTANTSAVCSQITGVDGQPWQRIVITVNTIASPMARMTIQFTAGQVVTAGQSVTGSIRAIITRNLTSFHPEFRVFESGGTGSGRSFDSGQMPLGSASGYYNTSGLGAAKLYPNNIDYDEAFQDSPKIANGVGSTTNFNLTVYVNTSGGNSITIDIARPKFNIT